MASSTDTKAPRPAPVPARVPKSPAALLRGVMREMKHVTWPTRRDALRMTTVVIALCVASTLFLFLVGWAAEALGALLWGGA